MVHDSEESLADLPICEQPSLFPKQKQRRAKHRVTHTHTHTHTRRATHSESPSEKPAKVNPRHRQQHTRHRSLHECVTMQISSFKTVRRNSSGPQCSNKVTQAQATQPIIPQSHGHASSTTGRALRKICQYYHQCDSLPLSPTHLSATGFVSCIIRKMVMGSVSASS